jgi:hypothetical protein
MDGARDRLATIVRAQAHDLEICEAAQLHLVEVLLRERLETLAIEPSPDLAVALMAVSVLLAQRTPEWGGDSRDVLGEIAQLGLRLLE